MRQTSQNKVLVGTHDQQGGWNVKRGTHNEELCFVWAPQLEIYFGWIVWLDFLLWLFVAINIFFDLRAPLRTSLNLHLIGLIVLVRTLFWLGALVRNLFWLNSLVRFFILITCYNRHFVLTWEPYLELHYDCRLQLNFCFIGFDVLVRTLFWLGALVRNFFRLDVPFKFFSPSAPVKLFFYLGATLRTSFWL